MGCAGTGNADGRAIGGRKCSGGVLCCPEGGQCEERGGGKRKTNKSDKYGGCSCHVVDSFVYKKMYCCKDCVVVCSRWWGRSRGVQIVEDVFGRKLRYAQHDPHAAVHDKELSNKRGGRSCRCGILVFVEIGLREKNRESHRILHSMF